MLSICAASGAFDGEAAAGTVTFLVWFFVWFFVLASLGAWMAVSYMRGDDRRTTVGLGLVFAATLLIPLTLFVGYAN